MKYIKGLEKALKKALDEQDEHPLSGSAARKVAMLRREIETAYKKKDEVSFTYTSSERQWNPYPNRDMDGR